MEFVEGDGPLANLLRAPVTNGKISLQDKVVGVPRRLWMPSHVFRLWALRRTLQV